ncbi:MAG: hypothetical protein AAB780_01555 [Patescibacteria group bacterium]
MPTIKKRLNITLDRDMERDINLLAKHQKQPMAAVGANLLREALELQEDLAWNRIVEERMKKKVKFIPNSDALWK